MAPSLARPRERESYGLAQHRMGVDACGDAKCCDRGGESHRSTERRVARLGPDLERGHLERDAQRALAVVTRTRRQQAHPGRIDITYTNAQLEQTYERRRCSAGPHLGRARPGAHGIAGHDPSARARLDTVAGRERARDTPRRIAVAPHARSQAGAGAFRSGAEAEPETRPSQLRLAGLREPERRAPGVEASSHGDRARLEIGKSPPSGL